MELSIRGLGKNNYKYVDWISIDIQDQKSNESMWTTLVKKHSYGMVTELGLVSAVRFDKQKRKGRKPWSENDNNIRKGIRIKWNVVCLGTESRCINQDPMSL